MFYNISIPVFLSDANITNDINFTRYGNQMKLEHQKRDPRPYKGLYYTKHYPITAL